MDHWLEWKTAQTANASAGQDRSDDPNCPRWGLYRLGYGCYGAAPITYLASLTTHTFWCGWGIRLFTLSDLLRYCIYLKVAYCARGQLVNEVVEPERE